MTEDGTGTPNLPAHDLHNHTVHCGHAAEDATAAALAVRAEEVGLAYLGISEHVIFAEEAGRIARVREDLARADLQGLSARVLVGVEIDPDPLRLDGSWVAEPLPVDYAILSPHRIPGYGVGHWQFHELGLSEGERRRVGERWLDWYEACVEHEDVRILGHPLREPVTLGLLSLREDRTLARALEILRRATRRGLVFELNNGWAMGLKARGDLEPYAALVSDLKAEGMRFCRGSDSHKLSDVGSAEGIRRLAQAAGLEPHDWLDPADLVSRGAS